MVTTKGFKQPLKIIKATSQFSNLVLNYVQYVEYIELYVEYIELWSYEYIELWSYVLMNKRNKSPVCLRNSVGKETVRTSNFMLLVEV